MAKEKEKIGTSVNFQISHWIKLAIPQIERKASAEICQNPYLFGGLVSHLENFECTRFFFQFFISLTLVDQKVQQFFLQLTTVHFGFDFQNRQVKV